MGYARLQGTNTARVATARLWLNHIPLHPIAPAAFELVGKDVGSFITDLTAATAAMRSATARSSAREQELKGAKAESAAWIAPCVAWAKRVRLVTRAFPTAPWARDADEASRVIRSIPSCVDRIPKTLQALRNPAASPHVDRALLDPGDELARALLAAEARVAAAEDAYAKAKDAEHVAASRLHDVMRYLLAAWDDARAATPSLAPLPMGPMRQVQSGWKSRSKPPLEPGSGDEDGAASEDAAPPHGGAGCTTDDGGAPEANPDDSKANSDDSKANSDDSEANSGDSEANSANSEANSDDSKANSDDSKANSGNSKANCDDSEANSVDFELKIRAVGS